MVPHFRSRWSTCTVLSAVHLCVANVAFAATIGSPDIPSIFSPASTPADSIYHLSLFVLEVCFVIFAVVFSLLVYSVVKFRRRPGDDGREPAQIYGSNQVELAWTVIPILIVVVLFLATRASHPCGGGLPAFLPAQPR